MRTAAVEASLRGARPCIYRVSCLSLLNVRRGRVRIAPAEYIYRLVRAELGLVSPFPAVEVLDRSRFALEPLVGVPGVVVDYFLVD